METEILAAIKESLAQAINNSLVGYNKPLDRLVSRVIEKHDAALFDLVDTEVGALCNSPEFRQEVRNALNTKLARTLVAKMEGALEKEVNTLRQNPATRARILLAIENIVKEAANG